MKNVHIGLRTKRQRGNAFVETGLIFTVFFCMLLGAFDFGQFLFVHQALVERARYASRWGAAAVGAGTYDPSTTAGATALQTAVQNQVLYYQSTAPGDTSNPYFGLTTANVQVTTSDIGSQDARLNLVITGYRYTMISPYIAGRYTGSDVSASVPFGM
jgi:Flp pilus assembly protein TadG